MQAFDTYSWPMSWNDWVHFEGPRSEWQAGCVHLMAGASHRHNQIVGDCFLALRTAFPRSCDVLGSDQKVQLATKATMPDVVVACDPVLDEAAVVLLNPQVVVEVLSPDSTETYDRTAKLEAYRSTKSCRQVWLVVQDEHLVDVWTRVAGDDWQHAAHVGGDTFDCCGHQIAVSDLYLQADRDQH